jgi:hypothetical protein
MFFTAAFVLICGLSARTLIKHFVSNERLKVFSSTDVGLMPLIATAVTAQILGHLILIGYYLNWPGGITGDIPPFASALFFPVSAVMIAAVTLLVLVGFGWFYKAAMILISNEPSPGT